MVRLAQITAPHFCAGVVCEKGRVVITAHILKYMRNWSEQKLESFCAMKTWKLHWIADSSD